MAKPAPPKRPAAAGMLSLKVTLRNTNPPIWRRILMPGSMTLADLHMALQTAMGWYSCHLHDFDVGGRRYGDPSDTDDFDDDGVVDESRLRLNALVKSGVTRFRYTYDYGDRWEHDPDREGASGRPNQGLARLRRRKAQLPARRLRRPLGLCETARNPR